jgi:hypothetical protein
MKLFLAITTALGCVVTGSELTSESKLPIAVRSAPEWGGYALLAQPCPSGTSECGSQRCCPNTTTCNTASFEKDQICCPNSSCISFLNIVSRHFIGLGSSANLKARRGLLGCGSFLTCLCRELLDSMGLESCSSLFCCRRSWHLRFLEGTSI